MTTFYVGQRVRLVRPAYASNKGATGVIVDLFAERVAVNGVVVNSACKWDREVIGLWSHTNMLEPLTPPPQLIAWDEACFDRDGKYRQEVRA